MRKYINSITCILLSFVLFLSCKEKDFSADYDIELPVSEIIDFNPKTDFIDKVVTIYGEKLDIVTSVSIENATCEIIDKTATTLKFRVSRSANNGVIVVTNKYKRESRSEEVFIPQYIDATVTLWPTEIERGRAFNIGGENMDMVQAVKFEDKQLKKASASKTVATFTTADISLPTSGKLTVTTKTGQVIVSPVINVIEPKDTYDPSPTILLFDFDEIQPNIVGGDGSGFTSGKNMNGLTPMFGNYYSVVAPVGNGWNGIYQYLEATNKGEGFDLTNYNEPYITFLVNTNGNQGYFNPAITIGGSTEDKHFTGQDGEYTDNYKIVTNGWEWRSYKLKDMGFTNVKTVIEKIALQIRGGNVGNGNDEKFELHLDQVMITDGPLNPLLMFDFETDPAYEAEGSPISGFNLGSGALSIPQGNKYFTVKEANVAQWSGKGSIKVSDINGGKFDANKSFYINFLINTGNNSASGYFQLIFEQGSDTKLGYHFKGDNPYGDNYKFASTGGKWQWRSYKIDPKGLENWGTNPELSLLSPFNFTVNYTTGNVDGKYEVDLDYVVLTSVPMDSK